MMPLKLVMTTAGLSRFTAAQVDNGVDLTVTSVGLSAANFVAAPTLTALPGEFRRIATISGESAGDNIVHMTVQDEEAATYTVLGFGLFLGDGTLFATYSQSVPIAEKSASSMLAIVLDIVFPDAGVENIVFGNTNFLNPPATTERKGVVELATVAEGLAGGDPQRVPSVQVAAAMIADRVPAGLILLWYGRAADVPAGWVICDGSDVERADGSGAISTPDLRGRVAVGKSADREVGELFGAQQATSSQSGGHTHQVTATVDAAVTGAAIVTQARAVDAGGSADGVLTSATISDTGHTHASRGTAELAGAHDHGVDVTQPSIALHYIMKV